MAQLAQLTRAVLERTRSGIVGGPHRCCICSSQVSRFLPYRGGHRSAITRELDVVGSDVVNFSCPVCGSTDRERHLFLYLDHTDIWTKMRDAVVLHIAPERHLRARIEELPTKLYLTADIEVKTTHSVAFDMRSAPFASNSVDILIANHVLEHVIDLEGSLAEAARILKPGALAVLQTPYTPKLESTLQLDAIRTAESRELLYGQHDHVRLFGSDIFATIERSGFTNQSIQHSELCNADATILGVNPKEPFFLFGKRVSAPDNG